MVVGEELSGGLKFLAGGQLVSPWGAAVARRRGAGGAAGAGQPARRAREFAGSKHLLRSRVGAGGAVTSMESRRCADNDPAHVGVGRGGEGVRGVGYAREACLVRSRSRSGGRRR